MIDSSTNKRAPGNQNVEVAGFKRHFQTNLKNAHKTHLNQKFTKGDIKKQIAGPHQMMLSLITHKYKHNATFDLLQAEKL